VSTFHSTDARLVTFIRVANIEETELIAVAPSSEPMHQETIVYLRDQAGRCRRLALMTTDARMVSMLLAMADGCDRRADDLEAGTPKRS